MTVRPVSPERAVVLAVRTSHNAAAQVGRLAREAGVSRSDLLRRLLSMGVRQWVEGVRE